MAIDLSSIFRKINQRRATGGTVPQGFAEDVLKANLGAEIARSQEEQRLAEQKRQFEVSKAEQTRQFDVNKAFQEDQAAKVAAARASEFATTTDLTKEAQSGQKTQGITSALVQAPMTYLAGKQVYGDVFGKTPTTATPATPTTTTPTTAMPDTGLGTLNQSLTSKVDYQPVTPAIEPTTTPAAENPIVPKTYKEPAYQGAGEDVYAGGTDVMPAEGGYVQGTEATAPAASQLTSTGGEQLYAGADAPWAGGATATGTEAAAGASTSAATLPVIGAAILGASLTKQNAKPSMDAGGPEGYLANSAQHPFAAVADPFTTANDLFGTGQSPVAKSEEWTTKQLGTVICTELHRQGLLADEVFENDRKYIVAPSVYAGYRLLADPVVRLMQKSPVFTLLIAPFAVRTAREMAHRVEPSIRGSWLGGVILAAFVPICGLLGSCPVKDVVNPIIP